MKIKICGVTRTEDAAALDGVVDYVGFVHDVHSPRHVDTWKLRELRRRVKTSTPVLVTASMPIETALRIAEELEIPVVQHHSITQPLSSNTVRLAPVVTYRSSTLVSEVQKWLNTPHEYVLVDADKKNYAHYEGGLKIPLSQLRDVVKLGKIAVAGGITPDNVHLVAVLSPYMIDISSGVEKSPGVKDMDKVRKILNAIGRG